MAQVKISFCVGIDEFPAIKNNLYFENLRSKLEFAASDMSDINDDLIAIKMIEAMKEYAETHDVRTSKNEHLKMTKSALNVVKKFFNK